jgi:hypothetical protein
MNSKQFRRHLQELLLAKQRTSAPVTEKPPTAESTPISGPKTAKEFRLHINQLLARQRNEDQPSPKKKPPGSVTPTRKFGVAVRCDPRAANRPQ